MQLFRKQPAAAVILSTLWTTGLLSSTAFANTSNNAPSQTQHLPNLTSAAAQATNTPTNKADTSAQGSSTPTPTTEAPVVITGGASGTNDVVVQITGAATATGGGGLTGLPKLPGGFTVVPAQVPPTANAPYMQESNLPAGAVFIAVGSILGFLALCVLLWRGLTVWALKRSVKRAAMANNMQDTKTLLNFRTPAPPLYKYSDRESTMSLSNLKKNVKSTRPSTATGGLGNTPGQSLFFSPTAGAAGGSSMLNPSNRGSSYLPSGYYAAGASTPGNGTGMAHIGGPGLSAREAISLSNLVPAAQGYSRTRSMGTTPPDSPNVASTLGVGHAGNLSTSTLDLSQRSAGRAPSAYLDNLFDEAGAAPGNYPVGHPAYQGNRS
jgi:hypothetical protein